MIGRMLRALARRASADDQSLAELVGLRAELDAAIDEAARRAHDDAGFSWTEIGDQLGLTRQAARQRFGVRASQRRGGAK